MSHDMSHDRTLPLPGSRSGGGSRMRVGATAVTASLAALGILAGTAPAQATAAPTTPAHAAPTRATAAHHTGGPRCKGQGVDPDAVIRYRSDILIKAPVSTVFKLQSDVENWPSWQKPVLSAKRLDHGKLRAGSQFQWSTPAPATDTTPETTLNITSTVHQLDRNSCIRWSGPAVGEGLRIDEGTHVWTFTKVRGGVRVRTEETWTGDQVEADVPTATAVLGTGIEEWLQELKVTAEAKAHHGGPRK